MEAAEDIALDFSMFDSEIKRSDKKNGSLHGSGTLYTSGSLLPVKDNLAYSSRSVYDDESDSRSNSDIYSSTSYGGTNSFMCSRTRSLQSQEDDSIAEELEVDERDKLWTSARSINELKPRQNNLLTRSTSRLVTPSMTKQSPPDSPVNSKRASSE